MRSTHRTKPDAQVRVSSKTTARAGEPGTIPSRAQQRAECYLTNQRMHGKMLAAHRSPQLQRSLAVDTFSTPSLVIFPILDKGSEAYLLTSIHAHEAFPETRFAIVSLCAWPAKQQDKHPSPVH